MDMGDPVTAFWTKVIKSPGDGCWEWTAGRSTGAGHGTSFLSIAGEKYAHRIAYALANGPIPVGLVVRHRCFNVLCVRPDHLLLGTQAENIKDTVEAGRHAHGVRHHDAVLSVEDVREARRLHAGGGYTYVELGRRFGVHAVTISLAIREKTWRLIDDHSLPQEPTVIDTN
jgi:hypothetical protein